MKIRMENTTQVVCFLSCIILLGELVFFKEAIAVTAIIVFFSAIISIPFTIIGSRINKK